MRCLVLDTPHTYLPLPWFYRPIHTYRGLPAPAVAAGHALHRFSSRTDAGPASVHTLPVARPARTVAVYRPVTVIYTWRFHTNLVLLPTRADTCAGSCRALPLPPDLRLPLYLPTVVTDPSCAI